MLLIKRGQIDPSHDSYFKVIFAVFFQIFIYLAHNKRINRSFQ